MYIRKRKYIQMKSNNTPLYIQPLKVIFTKFVSFFCWNLSHGKNPRQSYASLSNIIM